LQACQYILFSLHIILQLLGASPQPLTNLTLHKLYLQDFPSTHSQKEYIIMSGQISYMSSHTSTGSSRMSAEEYNRRVAKPLKPKSAAQKAAE
jgi:hypothetical protein